MTFAAMEEAMMKLRKEKEKASELKENAHVRKLNISLYGLGMMTYYRWFIERFMNW